MRYIIPCLLFVANSEIISLLALSVIMVFVIVDLLKARAGA
jgi:hypothetical protein